MTSVMIVDRNAVTIAETPGERERNNNTIIMTMMVMIMLRKIDLHNFFLTNKKSLYTARLTQHLQITDKTSLLFLLSDRQISINILKY